MFNNIKKFKLATAVLSLGAISSAAVVTTVGHPNQSRKAPTFISTNLLGDSKHLPTGNLLRGKRIVLTTNYDKVTLKRVLQGKSLASKLPMAQQRLANLLNGLQSGIIAQGGKAFIQDKDGDYFGNDAQGEVASPNKDPKDTAANKLTAIYGFIPDLVVAFNNFPTVATKAKNILDIYTLAPGIINEVPAPHPNKTDNSNFANNLVSDLLQMGAIALMPGLSPAAQDAGVNQTANPYLMNLAAPLEEAGVPYALINLRDNQQNNVSRTEAASRYEKIQQTMLTLTILNGITKYLSKVGILGNYNLNAFGQPGQNSNKYLNREYFKKLNELARQLAKWGDESKVAKKAIANDLPQGPSDDTAILKNKVVAANPSTKAISKLFKQILANKKNPKLIIQYIHQYFPNLTNEEAMALTNVLTTWIKS